MRRTLIGGGLVLLLVNSLTVRAGQADERLPLDAPDVVGYAETFGVPVETAADVIQFQDDVTLVLDSIVGEHPGVYGDARFVNGSDYGVEVGLNDVHSAVADAVLDQMAAVGVDVSRVSVVEITMSRAEYLAASKSLHETLTGDVGEVGRVAFDSFSGVFTVLVPTEDLIAATQQAVAGLPFEVVVELDAEPPEPVACDPPVIGWLEGGRLLRMHSQSNTYECGGNAWDNCTTGFSVTRGGWQGVLTAGHCGRGFDNWSTSYWSTIMYADGITDFAAVKAYYELSPTNQYADAEMHREVYDSSLLRGYVYLYGQTWRPVERFVHEHPNGTWVCMKGGKTALSRTHQEAWMCGPIVNNADAVQAGKHELAWASVDLSINPWARKGDSGGPVMSRYATTARGLLTDALRTEQDPFTLEPVGYRVYYNKIGFVLAQMDATLAIGGY